MGVKFEWFGDRAREHLIRLAAQRMRGAGEHGLEVARRLVPVDTGFLKSSLGYTFRQDTATLTLYADAHYSSSVEYGTSRHAARPYLRPALHAAAEHLMGTGATVRGQLGTER
jgi:hypothetical protein